LQCVAEPLAEDTDFYRRTTAKRGSTGEFFA